MTEVFHSHAKVLMDDEKGGVLIHRPDSRIYTRLALDPLGDFIEDLITEKRFWKKSYCYLGEAHLAFGYSGYVSSPYATIGICLPVFPPATTGIVLLFV